MPTTASAGAVRTRRLPERDPRGDVDRAVMRQPQIREGYPRGAAADGSRRS